MSDAEAESTAAFFDENWGTEEFGALGDPESRADPAFIRWQAKQQRMSCSPGQAGAHVRWQQQSDVRAFLPSIQVPTLVIHRKDVPFMTLDHGRYLAEHIPGARFVVVPGADLGLYGEHGAEVLDCMEEFLTQAPPKTQPERALATILFTDIVASTQTALALGDRQWRSVLESHDTLAHALVGQHRGRLVKMTGDGMLATFDGPGRAIRCALAFRDALTPVGINIRAGIHTGEVELLGDDIGGSGCTSPHESPVTPAAASYSLHRPSLC